LKIYPSAGSKEVASGTWKTEEVSLGQGKEVFDEEPVGACEALE
jgi:hypothetical protein